MQSMHIYISIALRSRMGPKQKMARVDLGPGQGDQGAPKNLAVAILPPHSDPPFNFSST